ncbi:MAG TPA: hypothetical protein VFA20_00400 [Myxococcaceae bacterium]|nr:hypothetical protein [Myxococcaceae bacterium]
MGSRRPALGRALARVLLSPAAMAVELGVWEEFERWFAWLSAADPALAEELAVAVDRYAEQVEEVAQKVAFDLCVSPCGRLAFVAAHAGGQVFLATGAEIDGSSRRSMILVSRARKVVRRMRHGPLALEPWVEVRRVLRPLSVGRAG